MSSTAPNVSRPGAGDPSRDTRITTAFLLGWSVSETLGLVRKGVHPGPTRAGRSPTYAPRLSVSEGFPQRSADAMIVAAERLVYLYQGLEFKSDLPPSLLDQEVNALPDRVRDWLEKKVESFYTPAELRRLLNDWSLEVWARLGGLAPDSAQAFAAGMSLADTYWYMRPLERRAQSAGEPQSQEDWRRLLSKYRLVVEQSRLLRLRRHFPPFVADVIRNHLGKWSIGTRLGYRDGSLALVDRQAATGELEPDDDKALQQALARQALYWNAMLFGFREATTYLMASDRWLIQIARTVGFLVTLIVVSAVLIVALVGVGYFLIVGALPYVQPVLTQWLAGQQVNVSDVLSVANLAWTLLIALRLPQLVGLGYRAAQNADRLIEDRLTVDRIARRTYVPWNRFM